MKIAVFHNLPSGGALRALYGKIEALEARGYEVSLYTFTSSDSGFFSVPRVSGEVFEEALSFRGPFRFHRYQKATANVSARINRGDCEWVLVEKCRFFGSPPILKQLTKPTLFYSQEPLRIQAYEVLAEDAVDDGREREVKALWHLPFHQKMKRIFRLHSHLKIREGDRGAIGSATWVATNSHFTAHWLKRAYGVNARVVYLGVDSDFFRPDTFRKRERHVLSVGRMDGTKGYDFLLDVLANIPEKERPSWIIICDTVDPECFQSFRSKARRSAVHYDLQQGISDEELRCYYQSCRLVLCAARHEPFGLVPLEAMACGTPVLAAAEGGFNESMAETEAGYLLPRNAPLWAGKIREILADEDLSGKLGEYGRRYIESKWTWKSFVDRLEEVVLSSESAAYAGRP